MHAGLFALVRHNPVSSRACGREVEGLRIDVRSKEDAWLMRQLWRWKSGADRVWSRAPWVRSGCWKSRSNTPIVHIG